MLAQIFRRFSLRRFSHVPALPPIPSSLSPWQQSNPRLSRQHRDPQIVESDKHTPLGPGSGGGDSPRGRNEGPSTNRINQLEKKVWMLEQANRSLKEELLQIQGETRSLHLTTDGCQQELERLRRLLESKTGYLEALSERVLQNEKRIEQGQGAVGSLVRSSQEVEKELLDGQREMVSRRDQLLVAMEHTQAHLHQLERRGVAFQETSGEEQRRLGEVVQRWRGSWERQSAETDSSVCGLKQQLKKLELEQETLVCVHACVCMCMCVCVRVCVHVHSCMCMCVHACVHVIRDVSHRLRAWSGRK